MTHVPRAKNSAWHLVHTHKMLTVIITSLMEKVNLGPGFSTAHFGKGIIELDQWLGNLFEHQLCWDSDGSLRKHLPGKHGLSMHLCTHLACSFRSRTSESKATITNGSSSPGVCGSLGWEQPVSYTAQYYLGPWVRLLWSFKPAAIFSLALYGQGRNESYRQGRGAKRLIAGLGRPEFLGLCHLPLPTRELESLTSSQSDKHGGEGGSVEVGMVGASMKMPGQVTLEQWFSNFFDHDLQ